MWEDLYKQAEKLFEQEIFLKAKILVKKALYEAKKESSKNHTNIATILNLLGLIYLE